MSPSDHATLFLRGSYRVQALLAAALILLVARAPAEVETAYYLPSGATYDETVPTPKDHLGFQIGERHLLHHQLVDYMQVLADSSDRVSIREYARSYGDRPLVLLTITSPRNRRRIDRISEQHRKLADPQTSDGVDLETLPAVINMGYSVHGNEPSASNVSPLVAYHLAAAQGDEIDDLLDQVVVLLDPCLNPDGFDRFAHWANNHRGEVLNGSPDHREHREGWPSGRTNYYWFDLNRDWLPAQHPESQGRLKIARRWLPNVVLDFHEMGGNSTFFFQPGVPKRTNPLTPQRNVALTNQIGAYHAKALDEIRSLYYTQERFDDFYMGKGSTYPDLHGGVGILFEQASSRGHVADTDNGTLTFPFTIRNQFRTSLSSLDAVLTLRSDLLEYKRSFYQDALALARAGKVAGYVVSAPGDPARLRDFLTILDRHGIRFSPLSEDLAVDQFKYQAERDVFIPTQQPEYRFLADLFARRTKFEENIFYDVSTWTLPLAFDLQYSALTTAPTASADDSSSLTEIPAADTLEFSDDDVGYLIDWRSRYAPRTLYRLLDAEIRATVSEVPFEIEDDAGRTEFGAGTVFVPISHQEEQLETIRSVLADVPRGDQTRIAPVRSSMTEVGADLGSSRFRTLTKPKILLVVGHGASTYEAGEVWHLLDQRFGVPVTLVDAHRLDDADLSKSNVLVMVSGSYGDVTDSAVSGIKQWLADGGTLIAVGSSINWLDRQQIVDVEFRRSPSDAEPQEPLRIPYADAADTAAFKLIKGAIFETHVDRTHPLGFGITDDRLPVFRSNSVMLEPAKNPYSTPVLYTDEPLLSGYVSGDNLDLLRGSASVVVQKSGRGRVILMADNPNFRAFWYGTNRLFLNAVFFGSVVSVPSN